LECLGEHAVGQLTGSLEEHHGDGLCAGKLAVEDRDDSGGFGTHVLLKLHKAPWESKSIALGDDFGDELIGDDDKANTEGVVEDKDELGGARVRAWRVQAPRYVVDAGDRDAEHSHLSRIFLELVPVAS